MAKITITLQDVEDESGRTVCRGNFSVDRQGGDPNGLATPAMMHAVTIRALSELGVIERMTPFAEAKMKLDELTDYLEGIGALDAAGNLHLVPVDVPGAAPVSPTATDPPQDERPS